MRTVGLVLALTPIFASGASAQSRPTAAQWRAAEAVIRDDLAASDRTAIDLTPQRRRRMGATFWVRSARADGQPHGGIMAVRSGAVIDASTEDGLRALMRADRLVELASWTLDDLLWALDAAGIRFPTGRSVFGADTAPRRWMRPTLVRTDRVVRLVAYAPSGLSPPEPPNGEHHYVDRATLTIDASYSLSWRLEEDLDLDRRGQPFAVVETPTTEERASARCLARRPPALVCHRPEVPPPALMSSRLRSRSPLRRARATTRRSTRPRPRADSDRGRNPGHDRGAGPRTARRRVKGRALTVILVACASS